MKNYSAMEAPSRREVVEKAKLGDRLMLSFRGAKPHPVVVTQIMRAPHRRISGAQAGAIEYIRIMFTAKPHEGRGMKIYPQQGKDETRGWWIETPTTRPRKKAEERLRFVVRDLINGGLENGSLFAGVPTSELEKYTQALALIFSGAESWRDWNGRQQTFNTTGATISMACSTIFAVQRFNFERDRDQLAPLRLCDAVAQRSK